MPDAKPLTAEEIALFRKVPWNFSATNGPWLATLAERDRTIERLGIELQQQTRETLNWQTSYEGCAKVLESERLRAERDKTDSEALTTKIEECARLTRELAERNEVVEAFRLETLDKRRELAEAQASSLATLDLAGRRLTALESANTQLVEAQVEIQRLLDTAREYWKDHPVSAPARAEGVKVQGYPIEGVDMACNDPREIKVEW